MRFGTPMQQMREAARKAPVTRGVDPAQVRQPVEPPVEPEPGIPEEPVAD